MPLLPTDNRARFGSIPRWCAVPHELQIDKSVNHPCDFDVLGLMVVHRVKAAHPKPSAGRLKGMNQSVHVSRMTIR